MREKNMEDIRKVLEEQENNLKNLMNSNYADKIIEISKI